MFTVEQIKAKREERARLVTQAEEILSGAENHKMSSEEEAKWDSIMADVDDHTKVIAQMERQNEANAFQQERIQARAGRENLTAGEAQGQAEDREKAFSNFLKFGVQGMPAQDRELLKDHAVNTKGIQMAQGVGTDGAGGFTVPDDISFMGMLREALLSFGGMRSVANVISTATGADLPIPQNNDTANKGEIIAESGAQNEQDLVFTQTVLQAYKYSSKLVKVSVELMQDSAINIAAILANAMGIRIARILNEHFTTGTGSGQPNGAVTASAAGKVGASATAVTYAELVDLIHSVDPAYRAQGAVLMFNDNTLRDLRKLVDGDSRPLWQAGVTAGEPATFLGFPYVINQDMATMASDAKSILFGAMQNYWIRDVLGIAVVRLNELYAANGQVGFFAFSRHDGDLINAGTNPVKHFQNAT